MVKELLRARIITGRVTSSVVFAQCVRFIGVMPRLDRGIQYAAACPLNHNGLGVLDRPVKPGDDSECGRSQMKCGWSVASNERGGS